jgi:hypothetical protein
MRYPVKGTAIQNENSVSEKLLIGDQPDLKWIIMDLTRINDSRSSGDRRVDTECGRHINYVSIRRRLQEAGIHL